ncbi:MAG: DoxX family membrane protein [Propionibacteriaceae bacterium]|nr:DoxX family membrane protein [Propionibacteriaceae bacterium]
MTVRQLARPRLSTIAPVVSTLVRLGLGGVLLAAGGLKVVDPQASVQAVRAFELLPPGLELLVGWGLPFVEISLGLLLMAGIFTRVAASVSAVLLVIFFAAVASAAVRGLSIDCGCFGGGGQVAAGQTEYGSEIIRDTGLLVLAAWLVWRPRSLFSLDRADLKDER